MSAGSERRVVSAPRERVSTLLQLSIAWSTGFAVIAAVALQTAVPVEVLLLDQAAVSGGRWYHGLVTSLGILAWTVSAVSCAGASLVARLAERPRAARTFAAAAAILCLLILDDLFQLHSSAVPDWFGVPKITLVAIEAAAVWWWLVACRPEIMRTRWELLLAAGVGLATSVVVDVTKPIGDARWSLLIEDGAKFLGVLALGAWAVSTARDLATSTVRAVPELPRNTGAARRVTERERGESPAKRKTPIDA